MTNHLKDRREYFRKELVTDASKQYFKSTVISTRASHKLHNISVAYDLATINYRKGDYHKAIKKYRLAAIIKPNHQRTFNAWGSCLSHLGRYDEAILKFKKSLEIDPYYGLPYLNWGLILFWQDKKSEAEAMIRKGLERTNLDVIESLYQMELASVEGRLEKAVSEEEKEFLEERIVGYNWMLELVDKVCEVEEDAF